MSQYLTKNRLILAKVQTAEGVDANPVPATDAVLLEDVAWPSGFQSVPTNEYGGSLDDDADIAGGGEQTVTARGLLRGSGLASTAPMLDPMYQCCGMLGAPLAAAVGGTAQGGTATTITLAAGASASDDAYVGMPINLTAGPGNGDTRTVVAYVGSTKVATVGQPFSANPTSATVYSIPANFRYVPVSSGLKQVTLADYATRSDGGLAKLRKALDLVGAFTVQADAGQAARINFDLRGGLQDDSDVAFPGAGVFQKTAPVPFMGVDVYLGGLLAHIPSFELTTGGEPTSVPDATATYGFGGAQITKRRMGGTLRLPEELKSTRDFVGNWRDGVTTPLVLRWGPKNNPVGKRVCITVPRLQYGPPERTDVNGQLFQQVPFRALGQNSGFYLTFY